VIAIAVIVIIVPILVELTFEDIVALVAAPSLSLAFALNDSSLSPKRPIRKAEAVKHRRKPPTKIAPKSSPNV